MRHITFSGDEQLHPASQSGWNNRYFIDTEFTGFEHPALISLAVVGENGHEFYGERHDFDPSACNEFVRAAVLPQMGRVAGRSMTLAQLRSELCNWFLRIPVSGCPTLCYELRMDLDLLFTLIDDSVLNGWKVEDVSTQLNAQRRALYYRRHGGEHHALHDARANAWACSR
ncbi:3'-5' exoribonuclease [Paraburkholderia kururiensis]|uniref:3'-5' exoribonuclease n=1 Tax=Paraburkholderia kururiensis TaxID=984307 RepID=UPI000F8728D2|nr:3'-5' exoribonuclease [Paraburkholderia kururiensis]